MSLSPDNAAASGSGHGTPLSDSSSTVGGGTQASTTYQLIAPPDPWSPMAPRFKGDNLSDFVDAYNRVRIRHRLSDDFAARLVQDYCTSDIRPEIDLMYEEGMSLNALFDAMKRKFGFRDVNLLVATEESLHMLASDCRSKQLTQEEFIARFKRVDVMASRQERPIPETTKIKILLRGIDDHLQRKAISRLQIQPLSPDGSKYSACLEWLEQALRTEKERRYLNTPFPDQGSSLNDYFRQEERGVDSRPQQQNSQALPPTPTIVRQTPPQAPRVQPPAATTVDEVDELVQHFKKLNLNAVELAPILKTVGLSSIQYARVLAAASSTRMPPPTNAPFPAPRADAGITRPYTSFQCYYCSTAGHIAPNCPKLQEWIDKGILHKEAVSNRLRWGTATNPEEHIPTLPQTERLKFLQQQYAARGGKEEVAVTSTTTAWIGSEGESDEDLECDPDLVVNSMEAYVIATGKAARDRPATAGVTDQSSRVYKKNIPKLRTSRPGWYAPTTEEEVDRSQTMPQEEPMHVEGQDGSHAEEVNDEDEGMTDSALAAKGKKRRRAIMMPHLLDEATSSDSSIVERIMQQRVEVPILDIIAKMPGVRGLLFKRLPADMADPVREKLEEREEARKAEVARKKADKVLVPFTTNARSNLAHVSNITANEIDRIIGAGNAVFRAEVPAVDMAIGKIKVTCLIDSGADINVMREDIAEKSGVPIGNLPPELLTLRMITASGGKASFSGFCMSVPVSIGGITICTPMLTSKSLSHACILGEPWACRASLETARTPTGIIKCSIRSEDGMSTVRFNATAGLPLLEGIEEATRLSRRSQFEAATEEEGKD